jgi:hypothetical protein
MLKMSSTANTTTTSGEKKPVEGFPSRGAGAPTLSLKMKK